MIAFLKIKISLKNGIGFQAIISSTTEYAIKLIIEMYFAC